MLCGKINILWSEISGPILGVAPSGPGTQAAQGFALTASVNVSDRPVTGQGVMGMKVQSSTTGRYMEKIILFSF